MKDQLTTQLEEAKQTADLLWEAFKEAEERNAPAIKELNDARSAWAKAHESVRGLEHLLTLKESNQLDEAVRDGVRGALEWLNLNAPGRAREALLKIINHKEP